MSILIKGMEMPDSCFLCRFCRRQEYGEYVGEDTAWSCVASKKRITDGQDLIATFKHPDCPLVEAAEVQNAVSKQAAIDVIRFECGEWTGLAKTIENKINELPSAQPEINHCRDCKHRGEEPIADGRYWCEIHDTFMYYCSDAERRTDD